MQDMKLQTDDAQIQKELLDWKIVAVRFEGMLYVLPKDFIVRVDSDGSELAEPYIVTRNRKLYENPSNPDRYKELVSPTAMYNTIKRHLEHARRELDSLEQQYGKREVRSDKLTQMTRTLKALKDPRSRRQTLFMANPRWVRMSHNEDDLYEEALSLVARTQIVDTTFVRDQLSIGNSEAEQLIKRLEDDEFVSRPKDSALKRTVFVTVDDMDKREVERNADK